MCMLIVASAYWEYVAAVHVEYPVACVGTDRWSGISSVLLAHVAGHTGNHKNHTLTVLLPLYGSSCSYE